MGKFKKEQNQDTEIFNPRTGKFEPMNSQNNEYQSICGDYKPVDLGGAVDTTPPKKKSKAIPVVIAIIVGAVVLHSCGKNNTSNNISNSENYEETQIAQTTADAQPIKSSKYEVEILNTYVDYDKYDEEQPVLLVEYSFKNNTDEAKSWMFSVSDKAFQNGIECGGTVYHDDINSEMQMNDVRPGYATTLTVGYPLYDTTSPVEIEVTEYILDDYITGTIVNLDFTAKSDIITLVAGEQGEYGKPMTMNKGTEFEENFFAYYVPYGTYKVTNIGEYVTQVNVYSDETVINEDGWEEIADSVCNDVLKVGESLTVTIPENYHVDISEPTHITLEPIR